MLMTLKQTAKTKILYCAEAKMNLRKVASLEVSWRKMKMFFSQILTVF
jgi:hypothetical protein